MCASLSISVNAFSSFSPNFLFGLNGHFLCTNQHHSRAIRDLPHAGCAFQSVVFLFVCVIISIIIGASTELNIRQSEKKEQQLILHTIFCKRNIFWPKNEQLSVAERKKVRKTSMKLLCEQDEATERDGATLSQIKAHNDA